MCRWPPLQIQSFHTRQPPPRRCVHTSAPTRRASAPQVLHAAFEKKHKAAVALRTAAASSCPLHYGLRSSPARILRCTSQQPSFSLHRGAPLCLTMAIRTHIKPRSPGSPRPTDRRRLRQLAQMRQLGQRPTGPPPHTNGRRIRPYALRRRLPAEWAFPIASLHRSAAPSSPSRRGLHGAPHAAQLSPIRKLQCRVMGMLERVRHSLDALPRPGAACSSPSSSTSSADAEALLGLQQHAGPLPSLGGEGSPAEVGPPPTPSDSHWESPPIGGGAVRQGVGLQSELPASLADSPAPQPSDQWQSPAAWMCAEKEMEGRASRVLDGTLEAADGT
ncbi:hypothetical protein AB1Y20_002119 [Prymnesium parvum]|uniref:Uncharacterized protein n=1 Tax=Prymnesium parvum TaxID=97485 RepID=A0AB34JA29_PRYPA